jgi:hypothetical protein
MIRHQRKRNQIDPEVRSLDFELIFDPELSMVEVLARERIVAEQETPPTDPSHDMQDSDFLGIKDFRSNDPCHNRPLRRTLNDFV